MSLLLVLNQTAGAVDARINWLALDTAAPAAGATALPAGVSASSAVGTPTATGAALALPSGQQASGAVGTPVAIGGANIPATAIPAGVQALGAVGVPVSTGAALAALVGVGAAGAVGVPVAIGGVSIPATALPAGVSAAGAVGSLGATGAAITVTTGQVAVGAVGTPVAIGETGGALAYPAGVQATGYVGALSTTAAARVIPIGVQAVGEVGEVLAYAGDEPPVVASSNHGFTMSVGMRYYIKRKGKILLFNSAEQADEYLATEQQAAVVKSRGAKKRIAAKLVKVAPIESIELEPVTELLSRYMPDVSLPNLLKMHDIEQVLAMQHRALMMQDDEDIELLLMTL